MPYEEVPNLENSVVVSSVSDEDYSDDSVESEYEIDPNFIKQATISEDDKKGIIIRMASPRRVQWDLFVMALAIWNCFSIPFFIAFNPDIAESNVMMAIDILIDFLFVVDIVINFRTSFMHPRTGEEIMDPKKIARHYLIGGRFVLDLLASIPFDLIATLAGAEDASLNAFGLLKLIRILRLGKIILYMRAREDIKGSMKLLQLLLFLLMYVHLWGCLWFIIVNDKQIWIPTTDFILLGTDLYDSGIWKQYWYSVYHSTFMLIGAEMGPVTNLQRFFSSIMILSGAMFQAVLFGEMAVLMADLNRKSSRFSEIQDTTNTTMKNMKLPEELQLKVSDYLVTSQNKLDFEDEYSAFEKNLKPSLKAELQDHVYRPLKRSLLFQNHEDLGGYLLNKLVNTFCKPEQDIVSQSEKGDQAYFLANGQCTVKMIDQIKRERIVRQLVKGEYFGELCLIYPTLRTCTVTASEYCTLAVMPIEVYKQTISKFPQMTLRLKELASQIYHDPWRNFIQRAFNKIPCFSENTDILNDEICYSMQVERYNPGEHIWRPGDVADRIMIITDGLVRITYSLADKTLYKGIESNRNPLFDTGFGPEIKDTLFPDSLTPELPRDSTIRSTFKRLTVTGRTTSKRVTAASMLGNIEKKSPFKIELPIVDLGIGSVLNGTAALMSNELGYTVEAIEQTVIYSISTSFLDKLIKNQSALKARIEDVKAANMIYDQFQDDNVNICPVIDVSKSFVYESPEDKQNRSEWRMRMNFKNTVLRRLINKRQLKLPNIRDMIEKLQAMVQAEELGKADLCRKIARGDVAPEAIDAEGVLSGLEIDNPLLTQFGSSIQKIKKLVIEKRGGLTKMEEATLRNSEVVKDLYEDVMNLKKRLNYFLSN